MTRRHDGKLNEKEGRKARQKKGMKEGRRE